MTIAQQIYRRYLMSNTNLNTTNSDINLNSNPTTNSTGETMNTINTNTTTEVPVMKYLKAVSALKPETRLALIENEEFRLNFSRYVSAKDKVAFMEAVVHVYNTKDNFLADVPADVVEAAKTLDVAGKAIEDVTKEEEYLLSIKSKLATEEEIDIPVDFVDEDEEYAPEEISELLELFDSEAPAELPEGLENIKGLVKYEFTKEQLAEQSAIAFIEKTIAYGRILYNVERFSESQVYSQGLSPWTPVLNLLKKFINEDLTHNNSTARKAWEIAKTNDKLKPSFEGASRYLKGQGSEFIASQSLQMKSNIFAKYTSTGFILDVNANSPLAKHYNVGTQTTVAINQKSLSLDAIIAASKVVLIDRGTVYKYTTNRRENELDTRAVHIPLFDALYLMRVCNVDVKSLLTSHENHIFLSYDKEGKVKVNQNPVDLVMNSSIRDMIGPSSPDTLKKGILKTNKTYTGFGEHLPGVGYRTIESTAAKVIARAMKLDKEVKHTVTLETVYAVVDTMGNVRARKALSTGTIHVPSSVTLKHGQFRAVSSADLGGLKCTSSPVAIINREWDEQNITLASFGSIKAKGYGIASLLGITPEEYHNTIGKEVKEVKFWGKPIKVVELKNVVLNITNHYTIQQYESTARNHLIMSLAEANEAVLERAEERASTITEDSVFVDYIIDQRDNVFGGSLLNTVTALLKAGEIKKKNKKVSITSSEYGIMSTIHSKEKANEWYNSLLADNEDSSKKEDMFRAIRFASHTYSMDKEQTLTISSADFFRDLVRIMKDNGIDANTGVPAFANRNFLVDIAEYFSDEEGKYLWLEVQGKDKSLYLPLGTYMYGDFANQSTIYDIKVQVTGFLSSLFKHTTYGTKYVFEKPMENLNTSYNFNSVFNQFVNNVQAELQAYSLGKKLGKLKAEGISGVLSVAWWTDTIDTVWCFSKKYYKTLGKQAVIAKHPLLFAESLVGAKVFAFLPKKLVSKLSKEQLQAIAFGFETTVFMSEEMALSLQNDADGDLVRLTWHSNFTLPLFTNQVSKEVYFASKFHNDYTEKERNFTKGCLDKVEYTNFTNTQILVGIKEAAKAKEGVAKYTSLAQKFERYADITRADKTDLKFISTHLLLNTMVQYFSMNAIKHTTSNGKSIKTLPEYFLLKDFDTKERKFYAPLFFSFLETIGGDNFLTGTGFTSKEEWLSYIELALASMKEYYVTDKMEDDAYLVVGKDFNLSRGDTLRSINLNNVMKSNTGYAYILKHYIGIFKDAKANGERFF